MVQSCLTRRDWIRGILPPLLLGASKARGFASLPPVRIITRGPKHHWFGYYDKFQFDPSNRYVLGMKVGFEHRSPRPTDSVEVGMVDLEHGDQWIVLGQSTAWCWQQGCMLQWVPGSESQILWNDREGDRYVCRILDVKTKKSSTIDHPVYSVSPDGKIAIAPDFRRINSVRPGYGYSGSPDPFSDNLAPEASGIVRVSLETGKQELILSIARIAKMGRIPRAKPGIKHYFNHLLFSPDGSRFVFLHRWRYPDGSRLTRMITANPDGTDIRILDDNGFTSHFIWRDPNHILAQSDQLSHGRANYLFEDRGHRIEAVGPGILDPYGHCSYLPGLEWILSDTYPDQNRNQNPHLYQIKTRRRISLGQFHSPKEYTGEWRCDTHPRFSRDGRLVCIDSPKGREGRQMHLIDISAIVG